VALLLAELFWPRHHYDVRRWATVFAAVVTAAATLAVAAALDLSWLDVAGEVLLWIAVAAWLGCTAWALAAARAAARRSRVRSRARR
jgi:tellurite resistance protein TehA-like permease